MRALRRAVLFACLGASPAFAAFTCTPTNNSILFGTYNPLSAALVDSTATFVVSCVNTGSRAVSVTYTVALSGQALRQMAPAAGSDRINYNVYTDTTRSTIWGDGTAGTGTLSGTISVPKKSSASTAPITYYGRIVAGQDVSATAAGSAPTAYSQSLTMTVTCTPDAC